MTCPICQTKPKATQHYCKKCAWEFEYYFDELSDEAREIYEDRFSIYRGVYANSIVEPKVIEKIVYRDREVIKEKQGFFSKLSKINEIITIDVFMYQNQPFSKKYTYKEAKEYAKNLRLGGFNDWRLPTKEELQKLITSTKNSGKNGEYYIRQEFVDNLESHGWFWTSEERTSSNAWGVYFLLGDVSWGNKTNKDYALCVRG